MEVKEKENKIISEEKNINIDICITEDNNEDNNYDIIKTEEKTENQNNITNLTDEIKNENINIIENNDKADNNITENTTKNKKNYDVFILFSILSIAFISISLISYLIFTLINTKNTQIISGVYIQGIDVSGLTKQEAKNKINEYINSNIPEEIKLKHGNFETSLSTSQLSIYFNIDESVEIAYNLGRDGNIFQNNLTILESLFSKTNIESGFSIDENQLKSSLQDISTKLPNKVIESSCYIDGNNLIITKGSPGYIVKVEETADNIKTNINNLTLQNTSLELITEKQSPNEINIDKLYNEIYKKPINAYYTQNPFCIYPSENGLDFAISLDEAKNLLQQKQSEYSIPLKTLYPTITTNMIGTEAFPDLLSEFSTKYATSNRNRTTNLTLAANKINGTVLMPNETFSYNKVVGERTIAAGYKEAPIYVEGRVEDGLGGGICQITTTLYNAALYANLDIIERSNHQFVPSYANASRDATVVYGAIDFKFKNNREYPIKITCSVSNGIANFKIFGLKSENDYEVEITSRITGSTKTAIYSESYKTLKKNGAIISTETITKDSYKRH